MTPNQRARAAVEITAVLLVMALAGLMLWVAVTGCTS
jgi:TRAP-type C4-dicarboxylate transport system permease small subunit